MSYRVILLVDESSAMKYAMPPPRGMSASGRGPAKTRSELVATAINVVLARICDTSDSSIALVGYRTGEDGTAEIQSRWSGNLAGSPFITTEEISRSPLRVEQRQRRSRTPGVDDEVIDFPIWYEPTTDGDAPQSAAFSFIEDLLDKQPQEDQTLVVHISSDDSSDGSPAEIISRITSGDSIDPAPLLLLARLPTPGETVPPSIFPSEPTFLPNDRAREAFEHSSELPGYMVNALRARKINVLENAHGLVHDAGMVELTHLLSLVKEFLAHLEEEPIDPPMDDEEGSEDDGGENDTGENDEQPEDEAGASGDDTSASIAPLSPEQPALVLFLVDRSVSADQHDEQDNVYCKLQTAVGNQLEKIVKLQSNAVDVGVITYGTDDAGNEDIRFVPEELVGNGECIRDIDLRDHALRIEESEERISNGAGGIIEVEHERPILFEHQASKDSTLLPVLTRTAEIISLWQLAHVSSSMPPIVLNFSRGDFETADIEQGTAALDQDTTFYNVVLTESDHVTVSCPDTAENINHPAIVSLWESSSLLLHAEQLAEEKAGVEPGSRGLVVNGNFAHLLYAIRLALPG